MREQLLISELGDLSQRLTTGWAVNAIEKLENAWGVT